MANDESKIAGKSLGDSHNTEAPAETSSAFDPYPQSAPTANTPFDLAPIISCDRSPTMMVSIGASGQLSKYVQ